MKFIIPTWLGLMLSILAVHNGGLRAESISFYKVPLVCGAAPHIGCGSRIKPFFMDTEKEPSIKESWTNRQGTVLAFVWNENTNIPEQEKVLRPLFERHGIESELVSEATEQSILRESLTNGKDQWLEGMEVDRLSLEEASVIAHSLTQYALDAGLTTKEENEKIRSEFEAYFKKELVIVRTEDALRSHETQERWKQDCFAIYEKNIGKKRAEKVSKFYKKHQMEYMDKESCCNEEDTDDCREKKLEKTLKSKITCPHCGHVETEKMPTDVCLISYSCKKCHAVLHQQDGDCCVFCSYGDHKCPSKQE